MPRQQEARRVLSVLVVGAADLADLLAVCGFRVRAVADEQEGRRLAADEPPDAIVFDLPGADASGCAFARELVARGGDARPMLVAATEKGPEEEGAACTAGFDFCFSRPVDPALLVGALRRLAQLLEEAE